MDRKARSTKIENEIEELKQDIIEINNKRDKNKSWTNISSNIIAMIALLFSFGTTFFSYNRMNEQDIHNTKNELNSILEKLSSLPKENYELMNRYKYNPIATSKLSGYIMQENIILANQAYDIIKKLPENIITGTEYYAVADAFVCIPDYDKAISLYKKAIFKINDITTEIAIHRSYANVLYQNGKIEEGRTEYDLANATFIIYNNYSFTFKTICYIQTEICWASSEISIGNKIEALRHISKANQYLKQLPNDMRSNYEKQIIQIFAIIDKYTQ